MKKLTSILLTLLIIISTLPIQITANAEETNEMESTTEETGYSLNMPFYLNDQEARCFLGFLFNTRELTQEQITNGNAYAFLTGQLSGDAEIESAFAFKDLMDAQLSRVVSNYEYGTEVGKQWILNYLYQKGHIKDNNDPDYAQPIVKSILKQISQNGIDYILDEYTVHGGSLQQMEFEYIQNGILVFDLLDKIKNIPEQIDEYKKMMLALAGSAFYAGGTNRLEMYKYFLFCKENMVYRHKYSEDIYQLVLSQQGLNEHIVAIKAIQPTLANWDFLDENILLWGTEERMALMEKWADFTYCMEEGLAQFPKNHFVDEENPSNPTQPQTEPSSQPTEPLPDIDETHCGNVGDCSWYLNTKVGTLYILGSGAMASYSSASSYPWYEYRGYVKSLYIADGVTNIGSNAFSGCTGVTGIIEVPKTVQTIGGGAFAKTKPQKMILPFIGQNRSSTANNAILGYLFGNYYDGVMKYQQYKPTDNYGGAYMGYYGIPDTITEIEITDATQLSFGALYNCTSLERVILNNGITKIGERAFYNCSGIKNLVLPTELTTIGDYAFYYCTGISDKVTIPSGVEKIGKYSFSDNSNVTEFIFESGLKTIDSYAFSNCTSIIDLSFPNTLESIGESAFSSCTNLSDIHIADGVTYIGANAFSNCTGVTGTIEVPKTVQTIGGAAFAKTKPQKMILPFIGQNRTSTANNAILGYLFGTYYDGVMKYQQYKPTDNYGGSFAGYYGIPDTITEIEITDATKISYGALYGLTTLKRVSFNADVTSINPNAFYGCSQLEYAYYYGDDLNNISISNTGNEPLINALKLSIDRIIGHSISLNGDIGINFYIDVPDEEVNAGKVKVDFTWTVDDEEKSYSVTLTPNDKTDYGYKATCPIPVAEMTYGVTSVVTIDGVLQSKPDTYSVQKYAKDILNNENNFKDSYISAENSAGRNGEQRYNDLVKLVKTMLDYGTKAQLTFDRNTDNLANEGTDFFNDSTDPVSADSITSTEENMDMDLSEYGLQYKGSTVVYLSETSIRHYYYVTDWDSFNKVKDSVIFDGAAVGYTEKDGAIYFEKKGVSAPNLDTPYALTIKDKTCKYSVNDYIRRCLASDKVSDNTKELVKATYRYNVAANTYFEI